MSSSNYTLTPYSGLLTANYAMDDGQWGYHLNTSTDALDSAIHILQPRAATYLPLNGLLLPTSKEGLAPGTYWRNGGFRMHRLSLIVCLLTLSGNACVLVRRWAKRRRKQWHERRQQAAPPRASCPIARRTRST